MRNTDADSSSRFICGDPAVQSNIVGAVNITTGWTFNTATAVNIIKKFKPKKFKRHDRNGDGKTHIGYLADEVLKAIPKEFENVDSKDREYLGLNYLVLPVLIHKAGLELNDKIDKLEKEIQELKKEKSK